MTALLKIRTRPIAKSQGHPIESNCHKDCSIFIKKLTVKIIFSVYEELFLFARKYVFSFIRTKITNAISPR